MKLRYAILSIAVTTFGSNLFAQTKTLDMELYSRNNIAILNPAILGLSNKEFAKCVEVKNFADPTLTHRFVIINGIQFSDNGKQHDLIGGDGILTSEKKFLYDDGSNVIPVNTYHSLKYDFVLTDPLFKFQNISGAGFEMELVRVNCKLKWVKCSSWPPPLQSACRTFSWPFNGGFEIVECEISWEH